MNSGPFKTSKLTIPDSFPINQYEWKVVIKYVESLKKCARNMLDHTLFAGNMLDHNLGKSKNLSDLWSIGVQVLGSEDSQLLT